MVLKSLKKNIKFAWRYAKDQKNVLIKYIISNIISIIISITVPILSAKIIINLTSNSFYQLIYIAGVIFVVENIRNIINYIAKNCSQIIYRETFSKIQIDLGRQILKLENTIIDNNGSGVFIQRITGDTSRLADIFNRQKGAANENTKLRIIKTALRRMFLISLPAKRNNLIFSPQY